ncbi:unnamed protein product [Pleuronectes platessa]|uniref:Uncharacterized protein n=1 Tax=Pleuronectes platessa TaxID=8262 RepID=A0A9N7VM06_PLEPL|nr:unnamed protein product [Pleuronectes platessa]
MNDMEIVEDLKNALLSAQAGMKTLKEELRKNTLLIQRETSENQARSNAYLDCRRALTETDKEMNICKKRVEVLNMENAALKEMWNGLTIEKSKLEDEVQQKDNAYKACLGTLTEKEKELKSCKAQCDALQAGHNLELMHVKETCRKELEVLQEEITALNETVNRLTTPEGKSHTEGERDNASSSRRLHNSLSALTVKTSELEHL